MAKELPNGQALKDLLTRAEGSGLEELEQAMLERGLSWEHVAYEGRSFIREASIEIEPDAKAFAAFALGFVRGFAAGHPGLEFSKPSED